MNKIGSSPVHKTSLSNKGGGGKGTEGTKEKKRVKIVPGRIINEFFYSLFVCRVIIKAPLNNRNNNRNNNNNSLIFY